eukprot:5167395-Alexandrium_andersonii.AAC.1
MCSHYIETLDQPHALPSSTTLIRHRLSVHMAWCVQMGFVLDEMMGQGGITRWGTVDASPQGGWDWQMIGFRTMANAHLFESFQDAHILWRHGLESDDDQDSEAPVHVRAAAQRLEQRLELTQGVPGGLG